MTNSDQLTLPFSESQILKARSLMKNKTEYLTVFEKIVNAFPVLLLKRKIENIKRHFRTLSLLLLHCADTWHRHIKLNLLLPSSAVGSGNFKIPHHPPSCITHFTIPSLHFPSNPFLTIFFLFPLLSTSDSVPSPSPSSSTSFNFTSIDK